MNSSLQIWLNLFVLIVLRLKFEICMPGKGEEITRLRALRLSTIHHWTVEMSRWQPVGAWLLDILCTALFLGHFPVSARPVARNFYMFQRYFWDQRRAGGIPSSSCHTPHFLLVDKKQISSSGFRQSVLILNFISPPPRY